MKRFLLIMPLLTALICYPASAQESSGITNSELQKLSADKRAQILGHDADTECVGQKAFFMGYGDDPKIKGYALWSVRCTSGKSYAVEIMPGVAGSTKVIACDLLKYYAPAECFKKMKGSAP